jgi:trimeric autotransporter adhesin
MRPASRSVLQGAHATRKTFTTTTAFGRTIAGKNAVAQAQKQLASIPEYRAAQAAVTPGRRTHPMGAAPAADAGTGGGAPPTTSTSSSSPDAACSRAASDLERVADICRNLPGAGDGPYMQAALRSAASAAESCQDFARGRRAVSALEAIARRAAGGDAAGSALDSRTGFDRADIAESLLAAARHSVSAAAASSSSSAVDLEATLATLDLTLHAASNIDELAHVSAGDTQALAALLPAALAHARAHALQLLVTRLRGKVAMPGAEAAAAATGAGGAPSPAPPAAGDARDKPQRPHTLQEAHLQVVLNTCDAADLVIAGTVNASSVESMEATALATRYFHARTALIRATARRNIAACYLLDAVSALTEGKKGSTTEDALREFGASATALSHMTAAHGHLMLALEQVNLATTRFRDLNATARTAAANAAHEAEAQKGGEEAGEGEAAAAAAAAAAASAAAASASPTARNGAWRRVGWELRVQRADLTTATAEVGLLMALWSAWQGADSPLGVGAAVSSAASASASASASATPTTTKTSPLFPLTAEQNDSIAPVLRTVSTAAEAALREHEALEAAYATAPAAERLATTDHGIDFGCGVARPLALIGLLQFMAGKAVTGEGVFRSALDRYAAIPSASLGSGGYSPSSLPQHAAKWAALPVWYGAHIAASLHAYSALLAQWDKRERESADLARHAAETLRGGGAALGLPVPVPVPPAAAGAETTTDAAKRSAFLATRTFATALMMAHVGSWGVLLPADLCEI